MPASAVLSTLFDEGQPVVVSAGYINPDNGQKVWVNRLFDKLAPAQAWIDRKARAKNNVYIKHASFTGEKHPKGAPKCDLNNVTGSRSFFVDLDCGEDKDYPTAADARHALKATLKALEPFAIPLPNLLQETGHGLHCVWVADAVFGKSEWILLNGILYSLLQENGLRVDVAAKALERGVRMCGPGYLNFKDAAGPAETKLLFVGPRIPSGVMQSHLLPHRLRVVQAGPTRKEIEEYATPGGFEFHIADVVEHCEVLKDAYHSHGANHGFAIWTDIVALCARDSDEQMGSAWAHHFSDGHAGYNPDDVDKKLQSYRTSGSEAYITCARFATTHPTACAACRFKGQITSCAKIPGILRRAIPAPLPASAGTPGELPGDDYANRPNGLTRKQDNELIWRDTHVSGVELYRDKNTFEYKLGMDVTAIGHGSAGVAEPIALTMVDLTNPKLLATRLAQFNMPVTGNEANRLHTVMTAWITRLKAARRSSDTYSRLGWSGDSFVTGDAVYGPTGVTPYSNAALTAFVPSGSLTTCQTINAQVLDPRPEIHTLVAASYGAPLVELCNGLDGFALNFYSDRSGMGKSFNAKRGAAVWGNPQALILGGNDTTNAIMHRLGELHSLPAYFDDPDMHDPIKQIRSLIYNTSRGVEKQRLGSDAKAQKFGTWRTFLIFLTNSRFSGMVDSEQLRGDAATARFLDFRVGQMDDDAMSNVTEFMRLSSLLDTNYGHLGAQYVRYLVQHRDIINSRLTAVTGALLPLTKTQPDDVSGRMQAAAGACLIVAADICLKMGLVELDPKLVNIAVQVALGHAKQARARGQKQVNPYAMVKVFCHDMATNRVVTIVDAQGRTHLAGSNQRVNPPIAYEVNRTKKVVWISVSELSKYFTLRKVSPLSTLDALKHLQARTTVALATGTEYSSTRQRVLELPLSDPQWSDLDV